MTTIAKTDHSLGNTVSFVARWSNLANGDDGVPVPFSQYSDKSVQVTGAFGAGGALTIEGSNNGDDWATLTDPQGNPLVFTSAKIELVSEATAYIRPRVTAGDGTTDLTVNLLLKE